MLCDLHVHTRFSYDSQTPLDALAQRAIEVGLTHVCFTDHIDMDPNDSGCGLYDFDGFFEEFAKVKAQYADRVTLLAGIEFAEPHVYTALLAQMKRDYPFDYVLGSLHWSGGNYASFSRILRPLEENYALYWQEMERMVAAGGFDAVSHFDLPKRYHGKTLYDEQQIAGIMRTIVKNGLCLECNTSTYRNGVQEGMPGPALLALYREAGGTRVMTGSDTHFVEHLGAMIRETTTALTAMGFETGYYQQRQFIKRED